MSENKFIRYFPSFLVSIGVVLWMNSLLFSPISNRQEMKLKSYWQTNLEASSDVIDSANHHRQLNVIRAIIKRPADKPLLGFGNKILDFQKKATKALNEKQQNFDTNTYQIIQDFYTNVTSLLWESAEKNPIITEQEIKDLLEKNQFKNTIVFNDLDYKIAYQNNQIHQITASVLDYLSRKTSGTVIVCCWHQREPVLRFTETLKVNHTSTAKIYLHDNPCGYYNRLQGEKWRINGQNLSVKNGVAMLKRSFSDTSAHILNVENEYYQHRFSHYQYTIDTFIQKEQFIIHPIKK